MEHALSDAGLALADVTLTRQELQRDGGRNCYEIEFVSETHVYEYEIDAATGLLRKGHVALRQPRVRQGCRLGGVNGLHPGTDR